MIKDAVKAALALAGFEIRRKRSYDPSEIDPIEFSKADLEVLDYVFENRLTMASRTRLIATISACKHAVQAEIEGDFVECGVWRGGNCIAAKLTFDNYGSDKKVWLFDTFAGMTAPSELDRTPFSETPANERFRNSQAEDHNEWCFASLDEVRRNFELARIDLSAVRFVAGDVADTLKLKENVPDAIAVLRLDTDFYDSTRVELQTLYPKLSAGGTLIVDDFGHWHGARLAVEEYFNGIAPRTRPLLHCIDYSARIGVKS